MASVVIPVLLSLFLGPGAGQLYNRDFKKGTLLILASLAVLIGAGWWYYKALQPFIPVDLMTTDPEAVKRILTNAAQEIGAKSRLLPFCQALLMTLWIYGIVDAYLSAQKKRRD
jgi:hypothetical protein